MALRNILDGVASVFAALVTSAMCGLPAWFTIVAIRADIAPNWAYGPAGVLVVVGLVLTFAFLRKASRGIAPSRQRRR